MKKKWEPKLIVTSPFETLTDEYEQRLYETAEILYKLICQLRKSKKIASAEPETLKRTGTDG